MLYIIVTHISANSRFRYAKPPKQYVHCIMARKQPVRWNKLKNKKI